MLNQKGASKMDAVVKLVLVFFVSLLSFSVGTFVGKQVSDSDYRRAALEQDYKGGREIASEGEGKEAGEKALSDDDIKSLTDEFVQAEKGKGAGEEGAAEAEEGTRETATEKTSADLKAEKDGYKKVAHKEAKAEHEGKAAAHEAKAAAHEAKAEHEAKPAHEAKSEHEGKAAHEVKAAHETVAKKGEGPSLAAERTAEGHSPTKSEPQERKPNAVLPAVANAAVGKYTVQVASYADEEEAKTQASELKEKGWNAFYIPGEVKGRTWYRVNVGLFPNSKTAMTFREKFAKEANSPSAIIQKIVQ